MLLIPPVRPINLIMIVETTYIGFRLVLQPEAKVWKWLFPVVKCDYLSILKSIEVLFN